MNLVTQVVWSVCDPIIHCHYYIFTIKTNALTNYYATLSPKWIPTIVKLMSHAYTYLHNPQEQSTMWLLPYFIMIIITKKGILKYFILHNPNGTWYMSTKFLIPAYYYCFCCCCLSRMQFNLLTNTMQFLNFQLTKIVSIQL